MIEGLRIRKYGHETETNEEGVDQKRIDGYAPGLSKIPNLIIVASGAVAVGQKIWRQQPHSGKKPISQRSLASIGSPRLFVAWQEALIRNGRLAGAIEVTHREIKDAKEGPSFQQALMDNLDAGLITILNENDALSIRELAKLAYGGDNDGLASHVASFIGAQTLELMTNVDGLYNSTGRVIEYVPFNPESHQYALDCAGDYNEQGQGMRTKVEAAIEAARVGIDAYIARAGVDIQSVYGGDSGTHFAASPILL